ncbi:hypothetical protein BH20VER3_BH20VER3_21510 [soil metagenome]
MGNALAPNERLTTDGAAGPRTGARATRKNLLDRIDLFAKKESAMKVSRAPVLLALLVSLATSGLAQTDEGVRSRINRSPGQASNVASVGYSRQLHALEIEFVRGAVYRFLHVPPQVHRELLASASKGHFIAEYIRGRYDFVRVRPRRRADPSDRPKLAQEK